MSILWGIELGPRLFGLAQLSLDIWQVYSSFQAEHPENNCHLIKPLFVKIHIQVSLISRTFKRIVAGVLVLALVTIAWVGATQCLKVLNIIGSVFVYQCLGEEEPITLASWIFYHIHSRWGEQSPLSKDSSMSKIYIDILTNILDFHHSFHYFRPYCLWQQLKNPFLQNFEDSHMMKHTAKTNNL